MADRCTSKTKVSVPLDAIAARAGTAIKVTYAQGTAGIGPLPVR